MNQRYAIRVVGQVQGVFFRASAQKEARRLGISGWVQNDPDGSVSLEAQATPSALQEFLRWCRQGPPSAHVENVSTRDVPVVDGEAGFRVCR